MIDSISLISGHPMPLLGLGTWQLRGQACKKAVQMAYELGYRHFDTAWLYQNQREIGEILRELRVDRSDIFLTSKIWRDSLTASLVKSQFQLCLDHLQMDYVDLLLIHWPSPEVPLTETLNAFMELHQQGRVKSIGVSNFDIDLIEEARAIAPISVNQVECHIGHHSPELQAYCQQHQVAITAYCPLAKQSILSHPTVLSVAEQQQRTAAQVALRWLVQKKIIVIPKASSHSHLKDNLDIFDWQLDDAQMNLLNSVN